jgi:TolB protein
MSIPRQVSSRLLAALAAACLVATLPLTSASAQTAPSKAQSPNGKIVFQSTQGSNGFINDIYVMDADGKHQTRLTDDSADDTNALWSPQGDKIAFLSTRRNYGYEIHLMNADGSNQRPLRDASPVAPFGGFEWSPDGTRLAYSDGSNLYVIAVEGTDPAVNVSVNKAAGTSDREFGWSPNGGQLVVRNFTSCGGCSDLYVVNAFDGGGRYQLSTGPDFDQSPHWSPAGDLVAYEGERNGRGIYVTRADGTGTETKVSGAVGAWGSAVWSPDGSHLAFVSTSGLVHVVKPDGTGPVAVSAEQVTGGNLFWSPDGSKVAFHIANADGGVDIFVVNADGSRRATNYTKTRRADEFAYSWQKIQ